MEDTELVELCRILLDRDADAALAFLQRHLKFLCTCNSCRSQMAEAIVNARLGDAWEAYSAGTQPAGYVHPLALRALAEIGISHAGRSKHADEHRTVPFDLVVTVCDDIAHKATALSQAQ